VRKVALIGNPNSGKTSVFNQLTGLNQHVGNYPGVTVDRHIGRFETVDGNEIEVIDLPGTYSIFPKSSDEQVATEILVKTDHGDHPDLVVVIVDATNLKRNLLLFTQIKDLGLPAVLVLNMVDLMAKEGLIIDSAKLSELLSGTSVVEVDAKQGKGIDKLKRSIQQHPLTKESAFLANSNISKNGNIESWTQDDQVADTHARYKQIRQILGFCLSKTETNKSRKILSQKIDRIVTHPIWGYAMFLLILFIIFQTIYELASVPMDLIDEVFLVSSQWVLKNLPEGVLTSLLAEGIIPGIGGVMIFIPQIALLFAFISILEESGYMSRVVFIMDRLMRPFGLSGKSMVPLMSGMACAIPAVMATRSVDQWTERLVTILVVPLTSCSARLPVYVLLIALVVPDEKTWGWLNLQGAALLFMYLLGFAGVLLVSIILKWLIRASRKSFLVMEMPTYKMPRLQNVWLLLYEKTKIFVWEAGKIIMAISIILWVLASYGPPGRIDQAVAEMNTASEEEVSAVRLENSYIGIMGKAIEPAIEPLGYDWRIGIALITSFAAREVFVSTMATIYSVGEDFEDDQTLMERMKKEINSNTGEKLYTMASGFSLMVFYAFAMQCMSTLAVVKRETKSWKWPIIQFVYMFVMAYAASFVTYGLLA